MGASPATVGAWVAQVAVEEVTEEDLAVESAEALVVALEAEVCRVMVEQMVEQVGTEAKEGGRVAEPRGVVLTAVADLGVRTVVWLAGAERVAGTAEALREAAARGVEVMADSAVAHMAAETVGGARGGAMLAEDEVAEVAWEVVEMDTAEARSHSPTD